MRTMILAAAMLALAGSGASAASLSYECWTYKGGKPDKYTKVTAANNADAVAKAVEKFRKLGVSSPSVKCK